MQRYGDYLVIQINIAIFAIKIWLFTPKQLGGLMYETY